VRLDKLALLRSSGRNQRWFVISAAIHVLVIAAVIWAVKPLRPRTVTYIDLGPSPEQSAMPAYRGPGTTTDSSQATMRPPTRGVPLPSPAPVSPTIREPAAVAEAPLTVGDNDSLPIDTHRELGPRYGDGRLWVRVGDAEAGRVPMKVAVDSMPPTVATVDSLLALKIRTYLDTVPPDSFATRSAPKWTTEIAGKTWGIDGKWIYLGGLKIPTAVLAMLPIPANAAGNYEAQQEARRMDARRQDIMQAAERMTNAVEFRKYVKELRARKAMEHEATVPPEPPAVTPDTTRKPEPLIP
jgi:hypothetical protein